MCPEGKLYFRDEERVRLSCLALKILKLIVLQRLLTITNLNTEDHHKKIEQGASHLISQLKTRSGIPADTCIVLARGSQDEKEVIIYYLASLSKQAVFWLEEVNSWVVTGFARAVVSQSHLGM